MHPRSSATWISSSTLTLSLPLALPVALTLALSMSLALSCAGQRPETLNVQNFMLAPCPSSPNCVSSDARDEQHSIAPFELLKPSREAWPAVAREVAARPRTNIILDTGGYLHAECTSRLMRFVDDLELQLRPEKGLIAVRSASRVGHSDLGANRKRVEELRAALIAEGLIR